MKKGIVCYYFSTNRYGFESDSTHYGLRCGDCFEILLNGKWIQTKLELEDDWYLVGLKDVSIIGQTIRME